MAQQSSNGQGGHGQGGHGSHGHGHGHGHSFNWGVSMISGGIAGMAAKTSIAPLERIKIIFQVSTQKFTFRDFCVEWMKIYNESGVRGFFRGNIPNIVRVFPYGGIQFVVYDFCVWSFRQMESEEDRKLNKVRGSHFYAGSAAGFAASIVTYPIEFLRTRMAMKIDQDLGIIKMCQKIYAQEGAKAFFGGLLSALLGVMLYKGAGTFVYQNMKDFSGQGRHNRQIPFYLEFTYGAIGSLTSQLISYPLDVVKKKMQAQSVQHLVDTNHQTKNIITIFPHIYNTEGLRGFFKGYTVNIIKSPINGGITFGLKNLIDQQITSVMNKK